MENTTKYFFKYGKIPIDNSATGSSIRSFTIDWVNWHIIDTIHSAEDSAFVCSLVKTAKADFLKIDKCPKHLLTENPKHMDRTNLYFLEDLFPW